MSNGPTAFMRCTDPSITPDPNAVRLPCPPAVELKEARREFSGLASLEEEVEAALEAELNGTGPKSDIKAHARHEEGKPTDDLHVAKKTSNVERKGSLMHAATSEDWRRMLESPSRSIRQACRLPSPQLLTAGLFQGLTCTPGVTPRLSVR